MGNQRHPSAPDRAGSQHDLEGQYAAAKRRVTTPNQGFLALEAPPDQRLLHNDYFGRYSEVSRSLHLAFDTQKSSIVAMGLPEDESERGEDHWPPRDLAKHLLGLALSATPLPATNATGKLAASPPPPSCEFAPRCTVANIQAKNACTQSNPRSTERTQIAPLPRASPPLARCDAAHRRSPHHALLARTNSLALSPRALAAHPTSVLDCSALHSTTAPILRYATAPPTAPPPQEDHTAMFL